MRNKSIPTLSEEAFEDAEKTYPSLMERAAQILEIVRQEYRIEDAPTYLEAVYIDDQGVTIYGSDPNYEDEDRPFLEKYTVSREEFLQPEWLVARLKEEEAQRAAYIAEQNMAMREFRYRQYLLLKKEFGE